jgi:hypothetical protein
MSRSSGSSAHGAVPPPANDDDSPGYSIACSLRDAKTKYHLGLFRVRLTQVQFHKHHRLQDRMWIDTLKRGMEEGVDRELYPVEATLASDSAWTKLNATELAQDGSAFLPDEIIVVVHDGTHRIEAWKECPGPQEDKWWYAVVYRRGE